MRRCNWILLSGFLLATTFLAPACSRQSDNNSAQGGTDDSGSSINGGAAEPRPPGPPMNFEKAAVTNLSQLFNTNNPTAFWTRPVDLSGVTVQQVFKDRQFIVVGSDKEHAVPVQLIESHPDIKPGQKLDLTGVINPTGHDKTQWNVLPEEQKLLAQHSIFIQERTIKPSRQ
jgi:hypothetical protein